MTKLVCDFTFDHQVYALTAQMDRAFDIVDCAALTNTGSRASDVHEQCALIGLLLRSGTTFEFFEHAIKLGPLTMSIVSAITRARDRAHHAIYSARHARNVHPERKAS